MYINLAVEIEKCYASFQWFRDKLTSGHLTGAITRSMADGTVVQQFVC